MSHYCQFRRFIQAFSSTFPFLHFWNFTHPWKLTSDTINSKYFPDLLGINKYPVPPIPVCLYVCLTLYLTVCLICQLYSQELLYLQLKHVSSWKAVILSFTFPLKLDQPQCCAHSKHLKPLSSETQLRWNLRKALEY